MTECTQCGESIDGDVMYPETGDGPMHTDCWTDWIEGAENHQEQDGDEQ